MIFHLDVNNDSLYDILSYSENEKNSPLAVNIGTKDSANYKSTDIHFPSYSQPINFWMPHGIWIEANGDTKKDLLVSFMIERDNNGAVTLADKLYNDDINTIRFYKNYGPSVNIIAGKSVDSFAVEKDSFLCKETIDIGSGSAPIFYDYDLDSLEDILISNSLHRDSWK